MTSVQSDDDEQSSSPAVVIVTPYSTGCCMALEIQRRGYKIICLWNAGFAEAMKKHVPKSCSSLSYELVLEEQSTMDETASMLLEQARLKSLHIVGCICGGEAGVDCADALSEKLGLLSNGTDVKNRRDKKVQQELIKAAGLRSVRQAAGTTFEEVQDFLQSEPYPVIVKPLDSAASDGVKRCDSYDEAKQHVLYLLHEHPMLNGGTCDVVLCQEFLKGKEYVVDHVSRDGVHKTVMTWVYDKRPVNGAAFVYFGDVPVESDSAEAKIIIPYIRGVLDALGVRNGPSHGEVIITEDGTPCLVEMNCRAHGGDGIWIPLCRTLTGGYCQVDAAIDALLDKESFDRLPDMPPSPFLAAGQCVDLVSYCSGTVKSAPGYDVIKLMPSFVHLETRVTPGTKVVPTIDMETDIGTVCLVNTDKEVFQRDVAMIRHMQESNLFFEYEKEEFERLTKNNRSTSIFEKQEKQFKLLDHKQRSSSEYYGSFGPLVRNPSFRHHRRIVSTAMY